MEVFDSRHRLITSPSAQLVINIRLSEMRVLSLAGVGVMSFAPRSACSSTGAPARSGERGLYPRAVRHDAQIK